MGVISSLLKVVDKAMGLYVPLPPLPSIGILHLPPPKNKKVEAVAAPVVTIQLEDCPVKDEDNFWDWMGRAMRDSERDVSTAENPPENEKTDPRLFSGSSSSPKQKVQVTTPPSWSAIGGMGTTGALQRLKRIKRRI